METINVADIAKGMHEPHIIKTKLSKCTQPRISHYQNKAVTIDNEEYANAVYKKEKIKWHDRH